MKTFLIIALALAALSGRAQNPVGVQHQLAASLPTPGMSSVTNYADGTSITNPPQSYWFFVSSNQSMIPATVIGAPVALAGITGSNVPSATFIQPYGKLLWFAAASSNSVVGLSPLGSPIFIQTPAAPIVFVQPLGSPTITTNY